MAAQELYPLRVSRDVVERLAYRSRERPDIRGGQRIEQPLVHREVEHHLQAVGLVAEVIHAFAGRDVRLGEQDGIAAAPLQEPPHLLEQLEILHRLDARALALHQKGNRIHAEARYTEL